jgi:hypothetical protein
MRALAAFLVALVAPASASAGSAFYGVNFSGIVNYVPPAIDDGTFEEGEEVFGFFRIDAGVEDSEPSAEDGHYEGAVSDRYLRIGDYEATASTGELFIRNAPGDPFADYFSVEGEVSGPAVAGLAPGNFAFSLLDPSRQVFSDDAIPSSLDLADFDAPVVVRLFFPDGNVSYGLELTISSLTYLPVPEPGGAWLAAAGALTMGALRGRRRREKARLADAA